MLICDDASAVRDALKRAVSGVPGVTRVDTVPNGEQALARWPLARHDLVLLDVSMPGIGGVETVRRLIHAHPEANVVMLTQAADRDAVAAAIASGARGFLHKDASREELCATVAHALDRGKNGTRESVPAMRVPPPSDLPALTERELQVLTGMAGGKSNAQIGRELYLSEDTIKTHARRLFRKLGVGDRAQAVAFGFRNGLVH